MPGFVEMLIYFGIAALLMFVGKFIAEGNNPIVIKLFSKIKIGDFKKMDPRYTANYFGYLIMWSIILVFIFVFLTVTDIVSYILIAMMFIVTLLYHISWATGYSLKESFERLSINKHTFSGNVFVRLTVVLSTTFIITGVLVKFVFVPILIK